MNVKWALITASVWTASGAFAAATYIALTLFLGSGRLV